MKRTTTILLILLTVKLIGAAQSVSFTAKAPKVVKVGERFRLTYEVNAQGSNFKGGDISAFQHLGGPSSGSSTQVSIVNGKMTQSISTSYTYVLAAGKEGKFTISPAKVTVKGQEYSSNQLTIEVVKGDASTQQQTIAGISNSDLFVRIVPNKTKVYKNEPITASVKLYTRVQLRELSDFQIPQFDGFWREDIADASRTVDWQRENVNGEIYSTAILKRFVLVPQKAGKLSIDPVDLELIALQEVKQQRRRGRNPFNDPFFDDFFDNRRYQPVKKKISSAAVPIDVKSVPTGTILVGSVKLKSEISATEVKANESVSLKITVSGDANLKLLEPFDIKFPADFDVFDPKTDQNIKVNTNGISGQKTFEYLIIPRHAGTYSIPKVELTYFNPRTGKSTKLETESYEIKVAKGDGTNDVTSIDHTGTNKEDIKFLGKDIRYLKTNDFTPSKPGDTWFGSTSFYMSYAAGLGGFLILFFLLRKKRKSSEDVVGTKNRKAAQLARKKLKEAENYVSSNDKNKYYETLLNALWGYIGDKLNIPLSELTKEKITDSLAKKSISEDNITALVSLVEKCEMARYAPVSDSSSLENEHAQAVEVISNIELQFRQSGSGNKIATTVLILFCIGSISFAGTSTTDISKARNLYDKGDYKGALEIYERIEKQGLEAFELYYNMGNAHYKLNNVAGAILYYERAKQINPSDEDLLFNLEFAQSKITDRIKSLPDWGFYKSFLGLFSTDSWAVVSVVLFFVALSGLFLFFYLSSVSQKKIGLSMAIIALILSGLTLLFASQRKSLIDNSEYAIVFQPSVTVNSTPGDSGTELFVIHEGLRVEVLETSGSYIKIKLADGNVGWVKSDTVKKI